jgi:Coenzyme PQQ synthesis protein D (PqqD)
VSAPSLLQVYARSDRMVGRKIAEEFVVVPLAGRGADLDSILNFNRVGAFIWELIDGRRTGRQIVAEVATRFDVDDRTAAADYLDFVGKLQELKAVRPVAT